MTDSEWVIDKMGLIENGQRPFVKYPRLLMVVKIPSMSVTKALYE